MHRLRQAANRLRLPAIAHAFAAIAEEVERSRMRAEAKARRQLEAGLHGESAALSEEIKQIRVQYEAKLAFAEEDKKRALKMQLVELTGSSAEKQALIAQQMKEERIELLQRQIGRRMMNKGLSEAWTAWFEMWSAKTYAMQRLREARAFQDWVLFWNARQAAKLFSSVQDKASLLKKQEADNKVLRSRLHEMEDKLEKATTEAKQLRVRVTQLEGGASEAELIREQMAAKAREERIELLQRQIGRRMMNRGLSEAWTAWIAMREARTSAMGRLREIANRLHAPEKSMAFSHWQRDWQEYLRQQQVRAMQEREDALEGTKVGLELELRALRAEFDQRLKAETEKRAVLLQKLAEISGGEASMQALLEAQAEQAKDQRVELLRRQITRRMMNAGLTSAWTAWFSMWQAKTHAMGRLREVANRLHAPEKSMAAELHEARAVLQKAGLKRDDGRIDQTEVQRIREEMEAKAKEERIELLRRQVGRRMMNKDLSEAWTAWFEMWSAKTYAMGRLREIANRLRAPEKSMAFSHWQRDWQEYLKHQQIRAWKQREDALEGTTAALEQELKALRVEYEGKLRQAEEAKHLALERQLISLTGTAEERKAAVEEQAREERIELLRRQIGRRMLNRSLSRGWSAWLEMWEAKTYAMGRLRQVGNRFREPGMSRAFAFWVDQWVETRRAKEMKELKQQSKNLDLELNKARFEAGRLALIKIKHEDTIKELESKLRYQMEDLAIKTNMLEGLSLTRRQNDELKDLSTSNAEAAELNAARLQAIEDAAEKQRKEDQELLQRLLDEQRQALELSVKADHEKSKAAEAMMKRMEDEIKHERDDLSKQHKELRDENTKLKKELDKVKKQVEKLLAKKRESPVVSGALGKIDLDEGPDAPPVSQQIAAALRKNSARVLDLFREWDADGDGDVTLAEFRRAMPKLGLNVPQKDIDALFNEWDKDGGGALNLRELQKILRAPPPASKDMGVNKDIAPPSMAGSAKGALALVKLGAMAKAFGS
ncbi:calmodulin-like 5 [Chrysochromulina tobinii]|uniref:Calmodulin-like 5 n=1 Tax=Chrysochromulina tobinii TaxID=1460289 RepID=A0A0M0JPZ8_9EUKA|nr:calmodulin-like 5 [Chrysochromulina tobinii]|eukprot:KOO28565.1 calmodulin-like 5 [Chrysochromulina sp. CCMP291]